MVIAGASRMSSVRGLNARPHSAIVLPFSEPKWRCILLDQQLLLRGVDLLDGFQDLEGVALVLRELEDRLDVLREAAAAVAAAREQEGGADALVRGDGAADLVDVGAVLLADVRHLVHERDARRQHGVRRVLAQLGARAVHHHDRRAGAGERRVELAHHLGAARIVGADDDAIGPQEVVDGGALLEELGVADDAERDAWSRGGSPRGPSRRCRPARCSCRR